MGKPSPPAPPDPQKTAAAQTGQNVSTAIANQQLQNVNQVTPFGNLTFSNTGAYDFTDPNSGKTYQVPLSTATQTLSPSQQAIFDQTQGASLNLAGLANEQSATVRDLLNEPFQFDNEATEARLFDLGSRRLNPLFEDREDALRTRLANQGIQAGSEAFEREFRGFNEGRNDAFNQLTLQGRALANQEQLTEANLPIDRILGILRGTGVQSPSFINTAQPQIPTTDIAGITNQAYQNQLGAFNSRQQSPFLGALGGLFSGLNFSDERVKKNVTKVGEVEGQNLYKFNYKDEPDEAPRHIGLMAQEVEKTKPEAVHNLFGVKVVDYDKALEDENADAL